MLTVIGEDRPGLVQALAGVVASHEGKWERSKLANLAGTFAGVGVVEVPDDRADDLRAALDTLAGVLHVGVHAAPGAPGSSAPGAAGAAAATEAPVTQVVTLDLLGNDRPGIVKELSGVFARHGLSIDELTTDTRDAPMAGGRLFEAHIVATGTADTDAVRDDLERLASELMVDIDLDIL